MSELARGHQVMLYVAGRLADLQDRGLVELTGLRVTVKGAAEYAILVASGFKPTEEEIEGAARFFGGAEALSLAKMIRMQEAGK